MDQCQCGLIIFAIIELFDKNMVSSDLRLGRAEERLKM